MKAERALGFLWGWALSFCISFGGVSALVTGFSFSQVALQGLLWFCLGVSFFAAAVWSIPKVGKLLPLLALLIGGALWIYGPLGNSVQTLVYQISVVYDRAYHWGVVQWSEEIPDAALEPALMAAAAALAIAVSGTICRQAAALPGVLAALLPLIACVVVTDTVPERWCLLLMIAGVGLLVLTGRTRRRSLREGSRLAALLLIPVGLATALLLWGLPQQSRPELEWEIPQEWMDWLRGETPGGVDATVTPEPVAEAIEVSLAELGARTQTHTPVMSVTTSGGGLLYLRGRAYDTYDGTRWLATDVGTGTDPGWPEAVDISQTVQICLAEAGEIAYFPVYPGMPLSSALFQKGALVNAEESTLLYYDWSGDWEPESGAGTASDLSAYEALPEQTQARAAAILEQIFPGEVALTVGEKAQYIAEYVRQCAQYSLQAGRMPSSETDFALWFLENGERGYCVHFATAATVLLRAAGIPARYVTGYMVPTDAGEQMQVTTDDAHAWTEYYDPERGWMTLDATPGGTQNVPPEETTAPTTPAQTDPVQTTGPAPAPTLPTEETLRLTEEPTEQATAPVNAGTEQPVDLSWLWRSLAILGGIAGGCLALWGQYRLRLAWRRQRRRRGDANRQALEQWRQLCRDARHLGQKPPERLEFLAEKAKFSQHQLTQQELAEFRSFRRSLSQIRKAKRLPIRLGLALLWAVE